MYGYVFTNSQELLFLRRDHQQYTLLYTNKHVHDTAQALIPPYYVSLGECRGVLLFHSTENSKGLHQNQLPLPSLLTKAELWPK